MGAVGFMVNFRCQTIPVPCHARALLALGCNDDLSFHPDQPCSHNIRETRNYVQTAYPAFSSVLDEFAPHSSPSNIRSSWRPNIWEEYSITNGRDPAEHSLSIFRFLSDGTIPVRSHQSVFFVYQKIHVGDILVQ